MPGIRNSGRSRSSKRKPQALSQPGRARWWEFALALLCAAGAGVGAAYWFYSHGYILYYGDAESHLNIARRMVDARTPGYAQIGTVWLPLPHVLMALFVSDKRLWQTGLAGTIPSVACFIAGGLLFFAAVRKTFDSFSAAFAALLVFCLNPNLLYLQSTPMTESVFFMGLLGILFCTVSFGQSGSLFWIPLAAVFSVAASLTRYEGWFLIPAVTLYLLITGGEKRWKAAIVFGAIASLAPVYWMIHNWFYFGDPLEFYYGPYSARGIYQSYLDKGMDRYPGDHDWRLDFLYVRSAAQLASGAALMVLGVIGTLFVLFKRAIWPLVLLALPPIFYVLSMHGSGTPIFIPTLPPHGYYNSRYGLAMLPLLALGASGWVAILPAQARRYAAAGVVLVAIAPWIAYPRPESWICWKESQVNSEARRAWTHQAAEFLSANYKNGDGVFTMVGDMTGIFREAGIPFSETLNDGNNPEWQLAKVRPDFFLHEKWAVAQAGDAVSTALQNTRRGTPYRCVKMVKVQGAQVIEIYRRDAPATSPAP